MPSDIVISMVMLDRATLRSTRTCSAALQRAFPDEKVVTYNSDDEKNGVYSFSIGEYSLFVALMPAPIPWDQLDSLTRAAWHWPESATILRPHTAHIIITITNAPPDPLEANLLLTRVTFALLEVQPAVGVLWSGPAISSSEMFRSAASDLVSDQSIPILLWVSFNLIKEPNGEHAIVTQGMERLGHREMELLGDPNTKDSLEFALDLAIYVLRQGPVLKPGQTFGRTAEERFPISKRPWRWDSAKTALVLDMRSAPPKKSFFSRLLGK